MLTPPGGRPRRRLHDDSGLGLVEVLVAMVVIAVVFSGLAQLLVSSFRSVAVSEERLRATQIASEAIEELQALEWDRIGFYDDQWSSVPAVDGHTNWTVVSLGTTSPSPLPAGQPVPERALARDGISYDVDTAIVWDDVPPTPTSEMVRKRLQVTVSWDARAGTRSVTASSFVALPGQTAQSAAFYVTSSSAGAAYQLINDNGEPVDALGAPAPLTLEVETNRPADAVSASWTDRGGSPDGATLSDVGSGQEWQAANVLSTFVNGATAFSFTATAAGYTPYTDVETVTFLHDDVEPVGSPAFVSGLSNGKICLTNGGRTRSTLVFEAEVQGYQASDTAVLANGVSTWTGATTQTTQRGVVQRVTIPNNTLLVTVGGQATFQLTVQRTSALPSGPSVTSYGYQAEAC